VTDYDLGLMSMAIAYIILFIYIEVGNGAYQ
jgi:hypothetical protein